MSKFKTWEDECFPRMVIRNREGNVGLCVLWNLLDGVLSQLSQLDESPRLSVVGNLRTPLGISWFLRGLGKLPHVTTVVVWGSDLSQTGDALFALWDEGVSDDHRVPHFGWRLDPLVDRDSINRLRREVKLIDARSVPLDDLARFLSELPKWSLARQGVVFPPVEIPERSVFPHRGAVHLVASDPADGWIKVLNLLLGVGQERKTRKGETVIHAFNVLVTMPVPEEEIIGPPFDFIPADLERYYANFISPEPPPEGTDYRYGHRMQTWRNHNQLKEVIARLQKSSGTKRATIVLLDPTDLAELKDAPCIALGTFCIQNGVLDTSWTIRSNAMYSGWPFNLLSLIRVHRYAAERLGAGLGVIEILSQNVQIYEGSIPLAVEKTAQWGRVSEDFGPDYHFDPDPAGNFIFEVVDGRVRMTMTNPEGDRVLMEMMHSDPSALIGWVVEMMPWLARQHVRYLGAEQEKLRRVLEEGVPYVQG